MTKRGRLSFRLYVAGNSPNSAKAMANLNAFCREYLPERHDIEVIDVLKNPQLALAEGVLLTPMLVTLVPAPPRKIIGSLARRDLLWNALGLNGTAL